MIIHMSSFQSPNLLLLLGVFVSVARQHKYLSKVCVYTVMHLNIRVAIETRMLKRGFIHCRLLSVE